MANLSRIGRPYALAAFEYARENALLVQWQAFLEAAAEVTKNPAVADLLKDLKFSTAELAKLYDSVLESIMSSEQKNFLQLLAQNKRLNVLPEICETFAALCTELDKMSDVQITTAVQVEDSFKQQISTALTNRLQQKVTLQCDVDPAIIGGAVIRFGDNVIDSSVRGKLNRLLEFSLR